MQKPIEQAIQDAQQCAQQIDAKSTKRMLQKKQRNAFWIDAPPLTDAQVRELLETWKRAAKRRPN